MFLISGTGQPQVEVRLLSRTMRQHQASDEFAATPKGLRRWASAVGRRVRRAVTGSPLPPRWHIQQAYDFCLNEISRLQGVESSRAGVNSAELTAVARQAIHVAGLYEQDGLATKAGRLLQQFAATGEDAPTEGITAPVNTASRNMPKSSEAAESTPLRLAGMAAEGYRTRDALRHRWADEALRHLRCIQRPNGRIAGLPTTLAYLEAAYCQAEAAFRDAAWEFPAEIADDDGRAMEVLAWCRELPVNARLLDAGCGKGRYLKLIHKARPDLRLIGVDVSAQALSHVPDEVECRQGNLLRIPAEARECDAVLCVEALEHALLPVQAVAELCQVVRPGGHLLVIDKNRALQADSQTQPWETWFSPADLDCLLSRFCLDVTCREILHGARSRKSGLFLAGYGTRR